MDRSPRGADERARAAIAQAEPTIDVRRLRLREAAGRHFVDVVVGVRPDAAIGQGHAVADAVEAAVRAGPAGQRRRRPRRARRGHERPARARQRRGPDGPRRARGPQRGRGGGRRPARAVAAPQAAGRPPARRTPTPSPTRVEEAILRAVPEIADVHTHIEPLATGEEDVQEAGPRRRRRGARPSSTPSSAGAPAAPPGDVRLRRDARGIIALVTVALDPGAELGSAHATRLGHRARHPPRGARGRPGRHPHRAGLGPAHDGDEEHEGGGLDAGHRERDRRRRDVVEDPDERAPAQPRDPVGRGERPVRRSRAGPAGRGRPRRRAWSTPAPRGRRPTRARPAHATTAVVLKASQGTAAARTGSTTSAPSPRRS